MYGTSWNVHNGSYLVELTPWKLPHGRGTMEVISWTYTMEVTSLNLHHGSYLMKLTPWKLLSGTYAMQVT